MVCADIIQMILLIVFELIKLSYIIISYIPQILYWIYYFIKKTRIFFEDSNPFDEYYEIKLILSTVLLFTICKFTWKYLTGKFTSKSCFKCVNHTNRANCAEYSLVQFGYPNRRGRKTN